MQQCKVATGSGKFGSLETLPYISQSMNFNLKLGELCYLI